MNSNRQSPIERLQAEKQRVRSLCRQQEEKLSGDWEYIRDHSGSLLLSGITTLMFPGHKSATPGGEQSGQDSLFKGMLPVIWGMVKPILLSWLMEKAGTFIRNIFAEKKPQEE